MDTRSIKIPRAIGMLVFAYSFSCLFISFQSSALTVGVIHDNVTERHIFFEIEEDFKRKYPNMPFEFINMPSAMYKIKVDEWLTSKEGPDVLYWYAGERLQHFIRAGHVENLDDLAVQDKWNSKFSSAALQTSRYQNSIFALPVSYYQWGVFYNKQLLQQLDLQAPKNWQDFLIICQQLKQRDLEPIALGSKESWILGAWFDYLNLRLNGLDFHQQLLSGNIAFTDKAVLNVFEHWAKLVNNNYFLTGHQQLNWEQAMPFVYRGISAFTLIGNFFSSRIPANIEDKIGFMPFPQIVPASSGFEEAPMDVFFIRATSKNKTDAKTFLSYLSQAEVQKVYNDYSGGFPPNTASKVADNVFNQAGLQLLNSAEGLSQFFDRDSNAEFSAPALQIFAEFMQDPNVTETAKKLEALRQKIFIKNGAK